MPINSGGEAFPSSECHGMSLREWYAGMALQGILAGMLADPSVSNCPKPDDTARQAFRYADAMLAQNQNQIDTQRNKE